MAVAEARISFPNERVSSGLLPAVDLSVDACITCNVCVYTDAGPAGSSLGSGTQGEF